VLPRIRSAAENAQLLAIIKGKVTLSGGVWLDLTDTGAEGTWRWGDGSVLGYTNWDTGQPDDGGGGISEDYAAMKPSGKWIDFPSNPKGVLGATAAAGVACCSEGGVSQAVMNGTLLRIRAPPYIISQATLWSDAAKTQQIKAVTNSTGNAEITLRLDETIPAHKIFFIKVLVITPSVPKARDAPWRLDVLDPSPLPAKTNDGLTEGFPFVAVVGFDIFAYRSPPMAEIQVTITIDPKSVSPTEFWLVAPLGYNFTDDCFGSVEKTHSSQVTACQKADYYYGPSGLDTNYDKATHRQIARITCPKPGLSSKVTSLQIKVITPDFSPSDPRWYLSARNAEVNAQIGWAEQTTGLTVKQMPDAGVVYSGASGVSKNLVVFRFQATYRAPPGGKIRVWFPVGTKEVECEEQGNWQKISLRGEAKCVESSPKAPRKWVDLSLPDAMDPGEQAFGVAITVPDVTPHQNTFDILVYEPPADGGKVIDGAVGLPGMRSEDVIEPKAKELVWGDCKSNTVCEVQMQFEFEKDVKEKQIQDMIIKVPRTYKHAVTSPTQVTISGDLPIAGHTHNFSEPTYFPLALKLKEKDDKEPQIAKGDYTIQFPVKVPFRSPNNNVWILILCGVGTEKCLDEHSPRALVSMPFVGFKVGSTHPVGIKAVVSLTIRSAKLIGFLSMMSLICGLRSF
jgi:hypothetical protein